MGDGDLKTAQRRDFELENKMKAVHFCCERAPACMHVHAFPFVFVFHEYACESTFAYGITRD